MTREYPIKTASRLGVLTVTEHGDRIALRLTFNRYGDLGDEREIARQLSPVLVNFDHDPRPVVFEAPDYGTHVLIDADAQGRAFAIVTEETRQ